MTKPRRRSRIHFQPPFLVGALSMASLSAGGCVGLTTDGPAADGTGGSNALDGTGGPTGCPDILPTLGSPCAAEQVGISCGPTNACNQQHFTCRSDLVWSSPSPTCNPPRVTCPDPLPEPGESCYSYQSGLVCAEVTCNQAGIRCGEDGMWQFEYLACNPPEIFGMGGAGGFGGAPAGESEEP